MNLKEFLFTKKKQTRLKHAILCCLSDIVLYILKASCSLLHSARLLSALGCGI